jgi:hypothetical protein
LAHFEFIRCHLQLRHSLLQFGASAQFAGTWQLCQGYGEKGMDFVKPWPT